MTWDLFISHASEDKDDVARLLADMLQAKGMSVWYDEYTLKIGDGLRSSIDNGLAKSRYGVVILSPNFFGKQWPQQELEGLFSLESPERGRILPVWHQVTANDVRRFSPMLAGRVGIPTDSDLAKVVAKIASKVFVYQVNDHHGRTHEINLSECVAHGTPIVPSWFRSDSKRISSKWLEKRLKERAELRIYFKPSWCDGTWFIVDVPKEDGEVINLDQLRDLMPATATTTTTTTAPPPNPR
jgi:hypothetical protein